MPPGAGYPIEDFLEAITAQLDQTQDALRLKAVNRPLTFALKDFHVDLKVFVEMDQEGRVTFRPAGPNEEGASTVSIGFTTITRPMIEENTISMEMAQAPTLGELGLKREEQQRLAKVGVRNAAQLRNFQRSAGEDTLSRHTGLDLGRIKGALNLAKPRLEQIETEAPAPEPQIEVRPVERPPRPTEEWLDGPRPGGQDGHPGGGQLADRLRQGLTRRETPVAEGPRRLEIEPGASRLRMAGRNLMDGGRAPLARLDGRPLQLMEATSLAASFALPPGTRGGRLSVEMPDGTTEDFLLAERGGGRP